MLRAQGLGSLLHGGCMEILGGETSVFTIHVQGRCGFEGSMASVSTLQYLPWRPAHKNKRQAK